MTAQKPVSVPASEAGAAGNGPAAPQTAENTCRECGGTGRVDGVSCPTCGGRGTVRVTVGDA
jgi:DnaJ-class molecular chaperone